MTATAIRENAKQAPGDAKEAKKKPFLKSKKGIILIVVVLLLAGGAYKFLMPKPVVKPTGGDIVALDPNTVNLAGGHYLKVAVAVQLVEGKSTADTFKPSHAEELVIDEFSDRTVASLSTNLERKRLAAALESAVKRAYPGEVFDLFLTQFVTQ